MVARTEFWAKLGITVQFLALVRSLGEHLRLKAIYGPRLAIGQIEPFVVGAFIAAILCWLAVTLFFFKQYVLVVGVAAATVVVLLIYRLFTLG